MPTIKYDIKISSDISFIDIGQKAFKYSEISNDRFYKEYEDITLCSKLSKMGWGDKSSTSIGDNGVNIEPGSIFLDLENSHIMSMHSEYIPELTSNGYYFKSINHTFNISAAIYINSSLSKSIYRTFNTSGGDFYSIATTPHMHQAYGSVDPGYVDITIPIAGPIVYSLLPEYKHNIPVEDYDECAMGYIDYVNRKGISTDSFLDMCEYIDYNNSENILTTLDSIYIKTRYCPIYKSVSIIVRDLNDALHQVSASINEIDGSVAIDNYEMLSIGEIKSVYLFYGIVPSVIVSSNRFEDIRELINSKLSTAYIGISNKPNIDSDIISRDVAPIHISDYTEFSSTEILIPEIYDNIFLEPSSSININGSNVKAGDRLFITNNIVNNITLSATSNILDMMDPVEYSESKGRYIIKNYIQGLVSIYGKFKINNKDVLSHICFSRKQNGSIQDLYGYGTGGNSNSGFSNGSMISGSGGTAIVFTPSEAGNYTIDNSAISLIINPIEHGISIAMPASTLPEYISVTEVLDNGTENIFHDWEFQAPDIITLDSNKINTSAKYLVTLQPLINPTITTLHIYDGSFNAETLSRIYEYGDLFKGLYSINSKTIDIKIGSKLRSGAIKYFDSHMLVDVIFDKNAIIRTTSKFKHITT